MAWTLYRYILIDIIKLLLLSTSVMVVVLGFGAAIKPLGDGLLDASGLFRFLIVMMPAMLQFALPFSTAFAVTLVFNRLSGDNEILAMSAGGMGYGRIVMPVVMLAAVLGVFLFVMASWVLPAFNRQALQMVEEDVMRAAITKLEKGEYVEMGKMVLFSTHAESAEPPTLPGSAIQPSERISLMGVAIGQIDAETKQMRGGHTADSADILVFREDGRAWIQLRLQNPQYHGGLSEDPKMIRSEGGAAVIEELPNIELPTKQIGKMRAMSWPQLIDLTRNPDKFLLVTKSRKKLMDQLAGALVAKEIRDAINQLPDANVTQSVPDVVRFDAALPGEWYELSAAQAISAKGSVILSASAEKPVRVVQYRQGKPIRRFESLETGELKVALASGSVEPTVSLHMKNVKIIDQKLQGRATEKGEIRLPRLRWQTPIVAEYQSMPAPVLVLRANESLADVPGIANACEHLDLMVRILMARVNVEFHLRAATSLSCFLGALLGAIATIRFRHMIPLAVFFWVFIGLIGATVVMQGGRQFAKHRPDEVMIAILILWAGVVVMAGVIGMFYAKLSKN
jgi:lipopolysaccharide export system permease protein